MGFSKVPLKAIDRHARDQLLRASQSIPLNIAEGNGNDNDNE
jgi:four helix bundle protein